MGNRPETDTGTHHERQRLEQSDRLCGRGADRRARHAAAKRFSRGVRHHGALYHLRAHSPGDAGGFYLSD